MLVNVRQISTVKAINIETKITLPKEKKNTNHFSFNI